MRLTIIRANDYAENLTSSSYSAMLLTKVYLSAMSPHSSRKLFLYFFQVVVGNGKKMRTNDSSLTEPPEGYHSVGLITPDSKSNCSL